MSDVLKTIAVCAIVTLTVGCSSTPMSESFANHFGSAREDKDHGKCMSDNAMFNNRQLLVAPSAVQSAWSYCVKKSDVWYPGKDVPDSTAVIWKGE